MTESELKAQLIKLLASDFDLRSEVRGYNLLTRSVVRADIVGHPKTHLVDAGFVDAFFCIEVKAVPKEESDKRGRAAAWQALSYRLSEFDFGIPAFSFVFPSLRSFYCYDDSIDYVSPSKKDLESMEMRAKLREIEAVMQYGNVGWIEHSKKTQYSDEDVRLCFAAGRYWSRRRGVTPVKNLGTKLHVGTPK